MREYAIRRLLWMIPTLILALTMLFLLFQIIPGDPIRAAFGEEAPVGNLQYEALRHELGLDRPLYIRYFDWLWRAIRLDLGVSLYTGEKVWTEIFTRLPTTLTLITTAILIMAVLSIPLGIMAALYQDKWPDYVMRIIALAGLSLPNFWLAIIVILVLITLWGWYPPLNYATIVSDPWTALRQLAFPSLILGYRPVGIATRIVRSSLLENLGEDYVRTARAKGLIERLVLTRHAIPNSLIPVVTFFGLEGLILIGSAVIIEDVFGIPGIGGLTVLAVRQRDLYVVQGCIFVLILFSLILNLTIDLLYAKLDPRVRYGKR